MGEPTTTAFDAVRPVFRARAVLAGSGGELCCGMQLAEMAVAAALTIPVNASTQSKRESISAAFGAALGTSGISLDPLAAKAMIRFQFPGDLDALMSDLYRRGVTQSATVAISVRVEPARAGVTEAELLGKLAGLPAVSNAAFDGTTVSATVAAATVSLRSLHDAIISAGLTPVDHPRS